jgi:hypothetical protein
MVAGTGAGHIEQMPLGLVDRQRRQEPQFGYSDIMRLIDDDELEWRSAAIRLDGRLGGRTIPPRSEPAAVPRPDPIARSTTMFTQVPTITTAPGLNALAIDKEPANQLIRQHGDDAELAAARRADLMLDRGDLEGQTVWKRIRRAVVELQATPTGPVH